MPGHWERDLILGSSGTTAVGTLVERTTPLVVLVHMAKRYYALHGQQIAAPIHALQRPDRAALIWHNEIAYRG